MFYFLRENLFEPQNIIDFKPPKGEDTISRWIEGKEITLPTSPLECELLPDYGSEFADYFDSTIPVMSNRLIAHLIELGVNNFDQCPIIFRSPNTNEIFQNHSAVNFKGIYDAVDLSQSSHRLKFNKPFFTGPIVIDPNKVGDLQVFRLNGRPRYLVIKDKIAKALELKNYKALLIQPTEKYTGT